MIAVCGCKFSLYKTAAAKSIQRLAFAGGNVNSTAACNIVTLIAERCHPDSIIGPIIMASQLGGAGACVVSTFTGKE